MSDLVGLRIGLKATVSFLELVIDSIDHSNSIVVYMGELLQRCRQDLRDLEADPDLYSQTNLLWEEVSHFYDSTLQIGRVEKGE
mgnify:CR=1 FL=1